MRYDSSYRTNIPQPGTQQTDPRSIWLADDSFENRNMYPYDRPRNETTMYVLGKDGNTASRPRDLLDPELHRNHEKSYYFPATSELQPLPMSTEKTPAVGPSFSIQQTVPRVRRITSIFLSHELSVDSPSVHLGMVESKLVESARNVLANVQTTKEKDAFAVESGLSELLREVLAAVNSVKIIFVKPRGPERTDWKGIIHRAISMRNIIFGHRQGKGITNRMLMECYLSGIDCLELFGDEEAAGTLDTALRGLLDGIATARASKPSPPPPSSETDNAAVPRDELRDAKKLRRRGNLDETNSRDEKTKTSTASAKSPAQESIPTSDKQGKPGSKTDQHDDKRRKVAEIRIPDRDKSGPQVDQRVLEDDNPVEKRSGRGRVLRKRRLG